MTFEEWRKRMAIEISPVVLEEFAEMGLDGRAEVEKALVHSYKEWANEQQGSRP